MNCKKARALFSLRLDGGTTYEEQQGLDRHLEACSRCQMELRKLECTVRLVRDLPEIPAPDGFVETVMRSVRSARQAEATPQRTPLVEGIREWFGRVAWGSPRLTPAILALGLVVGVGGGMLLTRPTGQQEMLATEAVSELPADAEEGGTRESLAPAPSGPFEDLVQEMLRRAEADPEDAPAGRSPDLDWSSSPDPDARGLQVGASPRRDQTGSKERMSIAF